MLKKNKIRETSAYFINKFSKIYTWFLLSFLMFFFVIILIFNFYNLDDITYLPNEINSFEVVIARYNEDLSWIKKEFPTEKITVYNKGKDDLELPSNCTIIKLPNIGREAHTYLYHIINNYNQLAERTLFLQGFPYSFGYTISPLKSYKRIYKTKCKNIIAGKCTLKTTSALQERFLKGYKGTKWADTIYKNYDFLQFQKEFITPKDLEYVYFSYGAMFAVDKKKIHIHDIKYYQKIFNTLDNIAPIEGHYLERSWDVIFTENYK